MPAFSFIRLFYPLSPVASRDRDRLPISLLLRAFGASDSSLKQLAAHFGET